MRKKRAPEVKNLLAALKAKMAVKGATSEDIVATFKNQQADAIARENADLVDIALMRLVGQVGAAGQRSGSAQIEMFAEYGVRRTVLFHMSDGTKVHRQLDLMTLAEGREHLASRTKPRASSSTDVKELARLLDDIEPYKESEASTIGECWIAFQDSRDG